MDIHQLDPFGPQLILLIGVVFILTLTYGAILAVYNIFFHPLRHVPGPLLAAATDWYWIYYNLRGQRHLFTERLHELYGKTVRFGPNSLSFIEEQAWKDIYMHKQGRPQFQKTERAKPLNGAYSIIVAPDDVHARQRRMLSHAFSTKALQEQESILQGYIDLLIALFKEHARSKRALDAVSCFNFTTFDVIGDLSFGESFHNLELRRPHPWLSVIVHAIRYGVWLQALLKIPGAPILLRLRKLRMLLMPKRGVMAVHAREKINKRIKEGEGRSDFMSKILPHMREDGTGISRAEVDATVMVLIIAGAETTATLLSGCVYHLTRHPAVLQKLQQEVRHAFETAQEINMQRVNRLPYLHAVLEESLRLYPPVAIALPRTTPANGASVCGLWVPGNTTVGVPHRAAYRSSLNFAEPLSYIPERWLLDRDPRFEHDKRDVFQPFSAGPRNCLGKNLAYAEMKLILARLVYEFNFEMVEKGLEWDRQRVFTLYEKRPLLLQVTERT